MGDILYFLNEENIEEANNTEEDEEDEEGENYADDIIY
jgi:hypothetical protein